MQLGGSVTRRTLFVLATIVALGWSPPQAAASLIFTDQVRIDGQGLGAVLTLVTAHQNDLESGCVAWGGSASVFGPGACPSGIAGGNEIANGPGGTYALADLGIANWRDVAIVFNVSETGQDLSADLDQLAMSLYDAAGNTVHTFYLDRSSCLDAACTFTAGTGLGGAGDAHAAGHGPAGRWVSASPEAIADRAPGGGGPHVPSRPWSDALRRASAGSAT